MKATSLFGGVQVFTIIISIIRSKFVAILLGPSGLGIVSLLQSTLTLIASITNFGLRTSAVKDIASAVGTNNLKRVALIVTVMRRLVWFTGLLGAFFTVVFSFWLSQITFGNTNYAIAFIWLSITLLFNQLSSGQSVVLQGLSKLKLLAKSSVLGSFIGLLVTVPLYYYYGEKGIVPVLIITSATTLSLTWYFSRKVTIEKEEVDLARTIKEGRKMMVMGFMLSLSALITMIVSYLVRIFISNTGGIEDVGLYSAGFAIIGTYVGLVFAAMGTDFYPRLSVVAHDNIKSKLLINQQAEIGLLILAPILAIFFIFINWVIILLYSTKFIPINDMIQWAALGMYFKVASWAIGIILLAKGNAKLFFYSELLANAYILVFNILGYKYLGLEGLGLSFLMSYILVLLQVYFIANYNYKFSFTFEFYKVFGIQLILGVLCFMTVRLLPTPITYVIGIPLICISVWYSFKELNKRIGIYDIIKSKIKKP